MWRCAAVCVMACATSVSAETTTPAVQFPPVREQLRFLDARVDNKARPRRLGFGRLGRISRVAVSAGDKVRRNQVLATLTCPELEAALAAAEAELELKRLSFARRRQGPSAAEQEMAAERLALAQADLAIAQVAHERLAALFRQNGLIPKQEMEAAARRAAAARLEVAVRRHALQLLQDPIRPEDELEQAAIEKGHLALVSQARHQLAFCQILAPEDATVAAVHLWPGEIATASATVISIFDDSQRAVRARPAVSTIDLQEGRKVRLRLGAIPGRTFDGVVSSYDSTAASDGSMNTNCQQRDDTHRDWVWIDTAAPLVQVPMFSAVKVRIVPK